jgi:hypothetical protein
VAAALGMGVSTARAAEPTAEQLMKQIQELQAKVQQMEARQNEGLSAQAVDATVERVLNDANNRSQLMQMEGFTAGWTADKGFRIQDAAGNWVLHPFFQFQPRWVTNFRHSAPEFDTDGDFIGYDGDDDTESGFEIRRMKFGFDGNAFTPDLTYYFLWATDRDGGEVELEQAWIRYFFNDDWAFRIGQIRNPVFHEQDTSSSMVLAADRSLTNVLITGSNEPFTQAVTLNYAPAEGPITAEIGIGDGYDTGNTTFEDSSDGICGIFLRVNYFVSGARNSYKDFTARGNREDLFVIGAGVDYTSYDGEGDYRHTVDVQWENTGGLSVYAAYIANYVDSRDFDDEFYNWGLIAQVGYMLNEDWEVFGRGGYAKFDDEFLGEDTWCEITAGVNWYVGGGHNAKVTIDATVLPNGAPADFGSLGILDSDDTEVIVRGQFQLLL